MSTDSQGTARLGRKLVATELRKGGFAVRTVTVERRPTLLIERSGARRRVHVTAKLRGTWQTSTRYAAQTAAPELRDRVWIFVDVGRPEPEFYVVPEAWMVEDIYNAHQRYLAKYGGKRKLSPSSTHHAVRVERVAGWRDRWDLLEAEMSNS